MIESKIWENSPEKRNKTYGKWEVEDKKLRGFVWETKFLNNRSSRKFK